MVWWFAVWVGDLVVWYCIWFNSVYLLWVYAPAVWCGFDLLCLLCLLPVRCWFLGFAARVGDLVWFEF